MIITQSYIFEKYLFDFNFKLSLTNTDNNYD